MRFYIINHSTDSSIDKILRQELIFPLFNHLIEFPSPLTIDNNQIFYSIFIVKIYSFLFAR